jgi:membrane fusion protein (multidrug efflux system)
MMNLSDSDDRRQAMKSRISGINSFQPLLFSAKVHLSHIVVILGAVFVFMPGCGGETKPPAPPPPSVVVAPVVQETVAIYGEYVGQTESPRSVELRARVEGFLETIHFKEGSVVNKGDVLFIIDPRQYQADYHQVKAKIASDEAALLKARQDAKRFHALHEKDAVSTSRLESAIAREKEMEATVMADYQALKQAKLSLSYTKIVAPLSGRIGRTEVRVGSLVGKGEPTLLATISQIDPVYVNISVSERDYLLAFRRHEEITKQKRTNRSASKNAENITMILADDSIHPYKGFMNFVDRKVDEFTSTLPIRLEFPNPNGIVRPGQFARIRAVLEERKDALLVPQRAVQEAMEGASVFVVGPDNTVEKRRVQVGPRKGSRWVIEEGLNPGEQVITEGIQKVRQGIQVNLTTDNAPEDSSSSPPETSKTEQAPESLPET